MNSLHDTTSMKSSSDNAASIKKGRGRSKNAENRINQGNALQEHEKTIVVQIQREIIQNCTNKRTPSEKSENTNEHDELSTMDNDDVNELHNDADSDAKKSTTKRGRGRPKKSDRVDNEMKESVENCTTERTPSEKSENTNEHDELSTMENDDVKELHNDDDSDAIKSTTKRGRGRPKKSDSSIKHVQVNGTKRRTQPDKADDEMKTEHDGWLPRKRTRGRPRLSGKNQSTSFKKKSIENRTNERTPSEQSENTNEHDELTTIDNDDVKELHNDADSDAIKSTTKRGRGRPKKSDRVDDEMKTEDDCWLPRKRSGTPRRGADKKFVRSFVRQTKQPFISIRRGRGRPKKIINQETMTSIPSQEISIDDHPRVLIPKLCKLMYNLGWATGTGGGMSVKLDDKIYMAPSGVQKEMIKPEDIFVCDVSGEVVKKPLGALKLTECAPLFMNAFTLRGAGAVLHSHGECAILASLIFKGKEFRITHQEMLKGIKKGSTNEPYRYDETLVVPIIENVLYERDLTRRMRNAMEAYPECNAVIVRRHGVYIWGSTWQRAKSQSECYHYLFQLAVKMKQLGFEPDEFPKNEYGIVD